MNAFGGNSGYIGYSQSKRSLLAKIEGRFPKTHFKKYYGISEKKFKELEDRQVIYVSEWHHTSKFGNKTKFYTVYEDMIILFYLLIGNKERAFALYKNTRCYTNKIPFNIKSRDNRLKFLAEATEHFLNSQVAINDVLYYRGQMIKCYHHTKRRKAPVFTISNPV